MTGLKMDILLKGHWLYMISKNSRYIHYVGYCIHECYESLIRGIIGSNLHGSWLDWKWIFYKEVNVIALFRSTFTLVLLNYVLPGNQMGIKCTRQTNNTCQHRENTKFQSINKQMSSLTNKNHYLRHKSENVKSTQPSLSFLRNQQINWKKND